MFQASRHNNGVRTFVAAPLPAEAPEFGLAPTEQIAEAQVAAANAVFERVLCRPTLWRSEQGGVDVGDVLHHVRPLEVDACIVTQLGADNPTG